MKREFIRGNYHFKIRKRELNGKTANLNNPKYEVCVLAKNGSYRIIDRCMTLSAGHCIAINYVSEHETKEYISKSDKFYLNECLGLTPSDINLLYAICVERDETVREIIKGFLDLL